MNVGVNKDEMKRMGDIAVGQGMFFWHSQCCFMLKGRLRRIQGFERGRVGYALGACRATEEFRLFLLLLVWIWLENQVRRARRCVWWLRTLWRNRISFAMFAGGPLSRTGLPVSRCQHGEVRARQPQMANGREKRTSSDNSKTVLMVVLVNGHYGTP